MDALLNVSIPLWAVLAYMVLMCIVQALPRPTEESSPGFIFLYRFLHLISMNVALFVDPTKKLKAEMVDAADVHSLAVKQEQNAKNQAMAAGQQ